MENILYITSNNFNYFQDNIIDTPNSCTNHLNKTCLTGYRFEDDDHTIVTEVSE